MQHSANKTIHRIAIPLRSIATGEGWVAFLSQLCKKPILGEKMIKRPILVWGLVFLLAFLGGGGIYGGVSMLIDPTGKTLQMDTILPLLPVPNFILPGLFLVSVMGILPFFLAYSLIGKPAWAWGIKLAKWSKYYWAWTAAVGVGIILIIWLVIQAVLIGFQWPIQYITMVNGVLIVLVALIPKIREYYREI